MTGGEVSIRLEPTTTAVALSRVFVVSVLAGAGVAEEVVEDARVLVSDVATGLVAEGEEIVIEANLLDGSVTVSGNTAPLVPEAGAMLLGDLVELGDGRWALTVPVP